MKFLLARICCFLIFAVLSSVRSASIEAALESEANQTEPSEDQYANEETVFALRGKRIELPPSLNEGKAQLQTVWYKNGKRLRWNEKARAGRHGEILVLDRVDLNDSGVYAYDDMFGERSKPIVLEVVSPAFLTVEPAEIASSVEHKTVEISCEASGAPKPLVEWLRDGRELTVGGRYTITDAGHLQIQDVSFSDAGEYACRASNEYGSASATGRLEVKRRTRITEAPENRDSNHRGTAVFRCKAVGDSTLPLRIVWLRNGQPMDIESEPRVIQHLDNSLMIVKVKKSDSGTYTCVASTKLDEARAQATLAVHGEPDPPTILEVTCGSNDARVSWASVNDTRSPVLRYSVQYSTSFTPHTSVTAENRIPAGDRTRGIKLTPWASYTFRVIAWNKIGASEPSSRSSACTTLADVPHKNPDNVKVANDDPHKLVIAWTVMPRIEHHAPKFAYRVRYKRDDPEEEWTVEDVDDWQRNFLRIENQPTYQRYKIKVTAVNEKGECREPPREVVGFSGDDVPLQAPGNFTLEEIRSSTAVLLSWTKIPDEAVRGELRGYSIEYWFDGGGFTSHSKAVGADETRTLIDNLHPNEHYHASITARNRSFRGPASEVISFDTSEVSETL